MDLTNCLTPTANLTGLLSVVSVGLPEYVSEWETVNEASGSIINFNTDVAKNLVNCFVNVKGTKTNIFKPGKNLVYKIIEHANVEGIGLVSSSADYSLAVGVVKQGVTYTLTSGGGFVGGFFSEDPAIGGYTYNNSRIISNDRTFTAPIDGYVAFRTSYGYAQSQLEFGRYPTAYEAFTGLYTVSWADTVGSIASGLLNAITGELVVGTTTYKVDNVIIKSVNGNNLMYADTGNISVTYFETVGHKLGG